jgi:hypothetical protein
MSRRSIARIITAIGTVVIWAAVFLFDPQTMERPGSPVDGLVAVFFAWIAIGLLGGVGLLPFVWRRPMDWSHLVMMIAIVMTAVIALLHVVASFRHVPYRTIESISSAGACVQGFALFGGAVALFRLVTLRPVSDVGVIGRGNST